MEEPKNEIEKVTTEVKPKSKGRQDWGRKLGQMSKEYKKIKRDGKLIRTIDKNVVEDIKIDKHSHQMLQLQGYQIWIGLGAIVVAVVALYYQKKGCTPDKISEQIAHRPTSDCKSSTIPTPSVLTME